eukprot:1224683-Rhodomonas_salina.1
MVLSFTPVGGKDISYFEMSWSVTRVPLVPVYGVDRVPGGYPNVLLLYLKSLYPGTGGTRTASPATGASGGTTMWYPGTGTTKESE